jgi:hypothetical protein
VRPYTGKMFRHKISDYKNKVLSRKVRPGKKNAKEKTYKDKNMFLVEFYSNFADNCIYVKIVVFCVEV